jgi:drug/metabolite transporter (DMT)-like permease
MERVVGMGCIAISAVGFGMMPLFANIAYQAGATPVSVLFLRFSIAALIMLGITIKTQEAFPRGKSLLVLVLMGAVGYAGQSLSYFTALRFAPLEPVVAVGLAWTFMGERLTVINLCGGLMILTAALLLARFEAAPAYAVND